MFGNYDFEQRGDDRRKRSGYELGLGFSVQRNDPKLLLLSLQQADAEIKRFDAQVEWRERKVHHLIKRKVSQARSSRLLVEELKASRTLRQSVFAQKLEAYKNGSESIDNLIQARDGLSILRLLRKKKNKVPVIIITARSDVSERIEGLDLGADDYLVKPFYLEELIARLKSILRRSAGEGLSILQIKNLRLNLMTHTASRAGVDIELAPREFEVLELLMRTPGRVLSRTQIIEQVWEYHFDPDTNLVDVYIRRLRKKIDHEFDDKLIQTVRGIGYTLSAK
ncbi:MAG: winged helix-turn-helix domain-containing protein [Opitutales bacterium]